MRLPRHTMHTQHRPAERRISRQRLPSCEKCARTNAHVATRTGLFLYMRCPDCLHTWSIKKAVCAYAWRHYTS